MRYQADGERADKSGLRHPSRAVADRPDPQGETGTSSTDSTATGESSGSTTESTTTLSPDTTATYTDARGSTSRLTPARAPTQGHGG